MRTRRDFIVNVAAFGGSVSAAMAALDLAQPARAATGPFVLPGSVNGTRVVILGGGVAGGIQLGPVHLLQAGEVVAVDEGGVRRRDAVDGSA